MRRILFVFHVSSVGGGSYCLYNLLKAIDRTVFEPVVLLPGYGSLCDEISKLDIRIEYMPGMSTYPYSTSLLSYRSVRKLMGLIWVLWFQWLNSEIMKVMADQLIQQIIRTGFESF